MRDWGCQCSSAHGCVFRGGRGLLKFGGCRRRLRGCGLCVRLGVYSGDNTHEMLVQEDGLFQLSY